MLPAHLHIEVAKDCIAYKKHMVKESDTFTGVQKMTIIQVGKRRTDR